MEERSSGADLRTDAAKGREQPLVELRGISKRFSNGVLACDRVDLQVYKGQVLALLGENGAGKSTLMNILSGLVQPSAGEILVDGETVSLATGRDALALGISMVHQHFALVPPMTVGQNVTLGREPGRWLVSQREVNAHVNELSQRFKLSLDPKATVRDLPVGMQQRVEIVKALYYDARVLILDEPTAVLTPQEADYLFEVVHRLTASGRAIVFISHKLPEVKAIADRVVVLRGGQVVGEVSPSTSEAEFARLMVGRSVHLEASRSSPEPNRDEVLRLDKVSTSGSPGLRDVSLSVSSGEILGVAGVDGNGQLELEETIAGQRQPTAGTVTIAGRARARARRGQLREVVGRIPSDRTRCGLVATASIAENLRLADFDRPPFCRWGVVNGREVRRSASALITQFDVRARGPDQLAGTLSGGNQQKLVIAREVSRPTPVLVAAQPTRGLDVGATGFIHNQLARLRSEGRTVVLISADLDEILELSDRIVVMYEGRIVGESHDHDREEIGRMMAGVGTSAS